MVDNDRAVDAEEMCVEIAFSIYPRDMFIFWIGHWSLWWPL